MMIFQLAIVLLAAFSFTGANDSLREAYQAVQKRADRLATPPVIYYSRPYVYGDGQPEDIGYGYQKNLAPEVQFDNLPISFGDLAREEFDERAANALEKLLLDYIEESKGPRTRYPDKVSSSKRSVFRERDPEMDQRGMDGADAQSPSPFRERGKSRPSRIHGLVRGGGGSNPGPFAVPSARETQEDEDYLNVVSQLLEKYKEEQDPEELTEQDLEDVLEYLGGKDQKRRPYEDSYRSGYDLLASPDGWKRSSHSHHKRYQGPFDERYPYRGLQKRFPIAKRSPAYYPLPLERRKKSEVKTDAKTAAELNNIFDAAPNSSSSPATGGTKPPTKTNETTVPTSTSAPGQKELALIGTQAGKPLQLKKKSVDWSKYFGYDRKKKSSDWLVDQYLRQYGLSPMEKRTSQQQPTHNVDEKMRAMEDMIVDEAVKYTGAHEGSKDSKELQEVKDKVMAQLAAAYSLEKMRRALGEFKASIAAQKASAPPSHSIPAPQSAPEHEMKIREEKKEKSTSSSVPKLQKNYKYGSNRISQYDMDAFDDECPVISDITRKCEKIAVHMRTDKFIQLCGFHQLCSACGVEIGAATEEQCDQAFANETTELCDGDRSCLEVAKGTLEVLTDDSYHGMFSGSQSVECDYWSNPCLSNILPKMLRRRR